MNNNENKGNISLQISNDYIYSNGTEQSVTLLAFRMVALMHSPLAMWPDTITEDIITCSTSICTYFSAQKWVWLHETDHYYYCYPAQIASCTW